MSTQKTNIAIEVQKEFSGFLSDIELTPDQEKKLKKIVNVSKISKSIQIIPVTNDSLATKYQAAFFSRTFSIEFCNVLFQQNLKPFAYHYSSFQALLSILDSGLIRLSTVAGLNDRSENLVDDILYNKKISNKTHYKRVESSNRKFLLSCSDKKDNLNLWRLYGDDGRGACIRVRFDKKHLEKDFIHGRVLYSDEILKKVRDFNNRIVDDVHLKFLFQDFDYWRNFVKPKDYSDEQEVRVFFKNPKNKGRLNKKWYINSFGILSSYIEIPLWDDPAFCTIDEVLLGPKCPEKDHNTGQLQEYLRDKNLNKKIKVSFSDKDHYR